MFRSEELALKLFILLRRGEFVPAEYKVNSLLPSFFLAREVVLVESLDGDEFMRNLSS